MSDFKFLFDVKLQEMILQHTDTSRRTAHKDLSTSVGKDRQFKPRKIKSVTRLEKVEMHSATFRVENSIPSRKRTCPQQFDDGTAVNTHPTTTMVFFRQQYFEALNSI